MARRLPWDLEAASSKKTPQNRPRKTDANKQDNPSDSSATPAKTQTRLKQEPVTPTKNRRSTRTPSTSPPPGPPDVEPMRAGFDEDDAWMMVEDEFQTLAQSFTAHLHHAEYKRLVKKARDAPKKRLPEPVSPMPNATKRKLQRQALEQQQEEGLDRVIPKVNGDLSEEAEDEKIEDPWKGTSLARLMVAGSQEKRSLKGLEKLPSSTRAARGYQQSFSGSLDTSTTSQVVEPPQSSALDLSLSSTSNGSQVKKQSELSRSACPRNAETRVANTGVQDNGRNTSASGGPASNKSTIFPQETSDTQPTVRKRLGSPTLLKRKKLKKESTEDRLAEVPMFIL